ncbi:hypothetical protein BBK14_01950 [Parafrankia soli]|uniref:Uncharacterized protein n=1 Tax=Parafrankia soli TaxID=2599596 RepID=A0A1S1RMK8_9ACTN|nr:hypothetical protein [Parafrankia soli]OHV46635.1 hypothetical protein BBK14_01950 [Parafrankia soli]
MPDTPDDDYDQYAEAFGYSPDPADDKADLIAHEIRDDEESVRAADTAAAADPDECVAEVIDGVLAVEMCGCEDCQQAEGDEIERQVESGTITEDEALAQHARAGTL